MKELTQLFSWLFSTNPDRTLPTEQFEVLLRSFHITAKCRYNASIRLRRVGRFTFWTTIVLSLGLIFAPLLQLAHLKLAYPDAVINCFQVFLAVAVLVYSVVNATAGYDTRAHLLNDCGDRIKDLSRELRSELKGANGPDLKSYSARYSTIITDAEMHSRSDYSLAMLQAPDLYRITGLARVWKRFVILTSEIIPYLLPGVLVAIEAILLLDVVGVTKVLTSYMQALAAP